MTDFCPSKNVWEKKFEIVSQYTLLLQDIHDQFDYVEKYANNNITMKSVMPELVGHRLAMGFQLIKLKQPQVQITFSNRAI